MNKLLFTATIAFVMISCKKDRTCECTETTTFVSGSTNVVTTKPPETIEYEKMKASRAKSMCQKSTLVMSDSLTSTTVVNDCKLK